MKLDGTITINSGSVFSQYRGIANLGSLILKGDIKINLENVYGAVYAIINSGTVTYDQSADITWNGIDEASAISGKGTISDNRIS